MPEQVTVYDWYDEVQPLIIKHLGITKDEFRGSIYEDEYRDYWHVFLSLHDHTFRVNDSYFTMFTDYEPMEDWHVEHITEEYGTWALALPPAIDKTIMELTGDDGSSESEIVVWISW